MVKTAINLYSVRDLDESMTDILDRVADAGYDGVQFSGGFRDATPTEVVAKLEETGLETTGAHIDLDELEGDLEATYELYGQTLGCGSAVIPYLGDQHFESLEAVVETADRLSDIAADMRAYDWSVHYHNHAHEFIDLDPSGQFSSTEREDSHHAELTAFERFIQLADGVGIELDVGWALVGGSDPVDLIKTYRDRIDLLHMKDMVTDEKYGFREIGEGDVDMSACAAAASEADVDWLIYEHDQPTDPVASIETGAEFLNAL